MMTTSTRFAQLLDSSASCRWKIGVRMHEDVGELAEEVRQALSKLWVPDRVLAGLRRHDQDVLALTHCVVLGEHQADEGLAEPDAVGEESAVPLAATSRSAP